MLKKTYQVDIAEACAENWNEMAPRDKGRHCDKCAKTVIDFTNKTDRQIIAILEQQKGKLCGRLTTEQTNRVLSVDHSYVKAAKWKAFALMLTGSLGVNTINGQHKENHSVSSEIQLVETRKDLRIPTTTIDSYTPKIQTPQKIRIQGIISDADTGNPLVHAKVSHLGIQNVVATDRNGKYVLEIEPHIDRTNLLEISFVGFTTKEIQLDTENINDLTIDLNASLSESYHLLGEVVILRKSPKDSFRRKMSRRKSALMQFFKIRKDNRQHQKEATTNSSTPTEIVTIEGQLK